MQNQEPFIDKKHKSHWEIIITVGFSLLIILVFFLSYVNEFSAIWHLFLVKVAILTLLPGSLLFCVLTILYRNDPDKDKFRWIAILLAILFALLYAGNAATYRWDKKDGIQDTRGIQK